jgi:hypothetical protein
MCANCSINTSTVWRTGNAGLTLCNACGMFYNKHDHEHRPEHLIESARAKAQANAAAAAAGIIFNQGEALCQQLLPAATATATASATAAVAELSGPMAQSALPHMVTSEDDIINNHWLCLHNALAPHGSSLRLLPLH